MSKAKSLLVALTCILALPSVAGASTILGPVEPNFNPAFTQALNMPSGTLIFTASGPPSLQLTAPYDGVVTSWRIYTDDTYDESGLRLRRIARLGAESYVVTGGDRVEPLSAVSAAGPLHKNLLHAYAAHLPISAGEIVGVSLLKAATGSAIIPVLPLAETPEEKAAGWSYGCMGSPCEPNPPEGAVQGAILSKDQWVAMNATLEADADRDGLGDESQDPCVGACMPKETAATNVLSVSTPTPTVAAAKKCKKGFLKRNGKCVKKKHAKRKKS